jgi:hypothetical protein
MLSRSLAVPTLLAASVAVPYVATNAPDWKQQWNAPPAAGTAGGPTAPPLLGGDVLQRPVPSTTMPGGPGATLFPTQTPLEGTPAVSLGEVFRLDVTKDWVYARWPRKSTALAELDLFGVRVPLVTGAQLHDLAGSLTYYFGPEGRVRLISFRGRTGDTTQLVQLVTQRFGLQQQPTLVAGEQLFQIRDGEKVLSSLRTRPAPVLWASSPHDSFSVELDLQDPATARPLAQNLPPLPATVTPPPPAAQAATVSNAEAAAAEAKDDAEEKPVASGWKAFFPRRRVPSDQIPNLDHGNMYQ